MDVDVGVLDVVCEAVGVGASVFVSVFVSVWVGTEFWTLMGVGAVTGKDGVVWTDVLEAGFRGDTGDAGFVTLVIDFSQLLDVVTQGCHTGCPYGSGHVEERVWVMLPV